MRGPFALRILESKTRRISRPVMESIREESALPSIAERSTPRCSQMHVESNTDPIHLRGRG